jgi:hypothetical protein
MSYKDNPAHTGMMATRHASSHSLPPAEVKPVSVEELLARLRRTRSNTVLPEGRLRATIVAIAEVMRPGEHIDISVQNSDERQLRRWDDEGGAGGWS